MVAFLNNKDRSSLVYQKENKVKKILMKMIEEVEDNKEINLSNVD